MSCFVMLRAPFVAPVPLFVAPAKAGAHLQAPMRPQPVKNGANRLQLPREPGLDPGSALARRPG